MDGEEGPGDYFVSECVDKTSIVTKELGANLHL